MSNDRLEEALAAHLEHKELGGPEPDLSHLTADERAELQELLDVFDRTEGVAFGAGRATGVVPTTDSDDRAVGRLRTSTLAERLIGVLREELPARVRIAPDPSPYLSAVAGVRVSEQWIIGAYGGRIRVWILDLEHLDEVVFSSESLREVDHAFRIYPDTVALALVDHNLECLLVQPEDCAPRIEVPSGELSGRRYQRPIEDVATSVGAFLREWIPYWEPVAGFAEGGSLSIDVRPVAEAKASAAMGEQIAIGSRARKTNPKRSALEELGERETESLAAIASRIYEGREAPTRVTELLSELAKTS